MMEFAIDAVFDLDLVHLLVMIIDGVGWTIWEIEMKPFLYWLINSGK